MQTISQEIPLEKINIYGGTQARVKTNDDAIESYADEMMRGVVFPPIQVYFDGATYWLADGFHRFLATKRNERSTISAEVQPGGRTEALRHALGANSTNGVYRNNGDKRNSVEIALEEWPELANPVISEICKVSAELVRNCRQAMQKAGRIPEVTTVTGRDGKQYPGAVERQPRGKSEEPSSEKGGGGGGSGGGFAKSGGDGGALGGSTNELEYEARQMIRNGEINPFELRKMASSTPNDYAAATIKLLESMRRDDPKRREGLIRIKDWIERELRGENVLPANLGAADTATAVTEKVSLRDSADDDSVELDEDEPEDEEDVEESSDDDGDEREEN
ncbi:ParB N-terminal domain-containing protein [Oleiharenicola lentus]|uniref:ParB N-terminal domain-containing protein n=1 Tax=Oleiharenicola lentus TaxID=2508720 RepID=UPI003F674B04